MSSKNRIISKLRRQIVDQVALPEVVHGDWIQYENPTEQFGKMIELVGGSCTTVNSPSELNVHLDEFEQWRDARRVFSNVADVPGNVDLSAVDDPHELEDLDFVVYKADFAVAENGAVFVSDHELKHRVVFFITQYLVLVVDQQAIVHNMHEAYARSDIPKPGFGLFLSGPSKTADIEQSLVIGAHGCREMQVFLESSQ